MVPARYTPRPIQDVARDQFIGIAQEMAALIERTNDNTPQAWDTAASLASELHQSFEAVALSIRAASQD